MGSRMGFEYRYCFSVDDEIISRYGSWYEILHMRFVFETRTNFMVKGKFDDGGVNEEIIDSEIYDIGVHEDDRNEFVKFWLGARLKDYWMSDDEIQEFVLKAMAFAKQRAADTQQPMISIAVDMGVCTVQQEGEPINATIDRAIRPKFLYPIYLCPWIQGSRPTTGDVPEIPLLHILRKLCTSRVEDVDKELSRMEECVICFHSPTIGCQISSLQCGHAFHYHCIAQWLANQDTCPMCRRQAHNAFSTCEN